MDDKILELSTSIEFLGDEAEASISLNPNFQWCKIRVTDDSKNGNNQKIPTTEFDNIVRTGINAPIKMAKGKISDGHAEALGYPIGAIAQLKKSENYVDAIAALWKRERSEDIAKLKEMYASGNPPQVSWELSYTDSVIEDGVEALQGVNLNGLAVVGLPAYEGRTPIYAFASKDAKEDSKLEDQLTQLQSELDQAKAELETAKAELVSKDAELTDLRNYKQAVEASKQKAEKLASIKNKFVEAGVEKPEDYFVQNESILLGMEDGALDFMLQEMVAFSSKETKASKISVPAISTNVLEDLSDPKKLANSLKQRLVR